MTGRCCTVKLAWGIQLYLFLPVLLFEALWLDRILAIVMFALTLLLWREIRKVLEPMCSDFRFSPTIICQCLLLLVFLFSTGHGGFFLASGFDIPWRNAIYYDLIKYPWPVVYSNPECALIYYVGYWLVPAGISSFLGLNETASNVVLFVWTYIGLLLYYFLVCDYLRSRGKEYWIVTLILIFWSGLNIFGMLFHSIYGDAPLRIDAHNFFLAWVFKGGLFLRTTFDSMANVYNQYLYVGICTVLLLLNINKPEIYAAIGLLALPCTPIGFLGIFFLLTGYFFVRLPGLCRECGLNIILKRVLSKANLLACCTLLPLYYLYYSLNGATNYHRDTAGGGSIWLQDRLSITLLFIYYLVFFGIYGFLLYKSNKKNVLFWVALTILFILPHFAVGGSSDLNYNASMPSYILIMLLVMKEVIQGFRERCFYGSRLLLVLALVIAMITPMMQMTNSMRKCYLEKKIAVNEDLPQVGGTMADKNPFLYKNFLSYYYKGSFFYTYLTRTKYPW